MKQNKCIIINDNYNITNKLTMSYHSEIEQQRLADAQKKYNVWESLSQEDKSQMFFEKLKSMSENIAGLKEEYASGKMSEKSEFRLRLQKEEFAKEKEERAIQWREKVAKEQEERNKKKRENEYKLFLQKKELAKEQEEQKEDRYLQYKNLHQTHQPLNKTLTKSISQIVLENLNS